MKKVTIKDVAKASGVSVSSVSRYINNPGSINPIPAMNVEKAIRELGYIPNTYAQSLKKGHSNTIGVLVPGLGPFFSSVCTAFSDFFYQHRYLLFICNTEDEPEKERYYINALLGQRVAGLLIAPSGRNSDFLCEVHKQFSNLVMIDHWEENLPFDAVHEDSYLDSYNLTKLMLERGHRHLVLLFRPEQSTNTSQRLSGTTQALHEAGLKLSDMYVSFKDLSPDATHRKLADFLARSPRPTAVIAGSPLLLENALMSLNRMERKVPEQIDLAGYALHEFLPRYRLNIPLIIQDPYEMGVRAGDVLLRKLRRGNDKSLPRQYHLETRLHNPGPK